MAVEKSVKSVQKKTTVNYDSVVGLSARVKILELDKKKLEDRLNKLEAKLAIVIGEE